MSRHRPAPRAPVHAAGPARGHHRKPPRSGGRCWAWLAWVVGILFVLPVLWMVLTSLPHARPDAATNPPGTLRPAQPGGVPRPSSTPSPWPPLLNSLTASVLSTILVLLLAFPAAYALSIRPVKKWTDVLFFFLSTKMLPIVAGLLPIYLFAQTRRRAGQHLAADHPLHLDEPADRGLDDAVVPRRGAGRDARGRPGRRRRPASGPCGTIVAPVVMPGIAATALICFIFSWNELLLARVLTGTVGRYRAGVPHRLRHQPGAVPRQGLRRRRSWCRCRCWSPGSRPRTSSSRACRWAPVK